MQNWLTDNIVHRRIEASVIFLLCVKSVVQYATYPSILPYLIPWYTRTLWGDAHDIYRPMTFITMAATKDRYYEWSVVSDNLIVQIIIY